MRTPSRRIRANLVYLRRPFLQFLPVAIGMGLIVLSGGLAFSRLYEQDTISFREGLYITYCLIFMEHLLDFPRHWLLQVYYVALPPLGLAVILDGIVRFSYHILRRDERSPEWVAAMASTMKDHVILFGLGKVGLRTLQELLRLGELVLVVEKNPDCPNIPFAKQHGVPVRTGMGREAGLLDELNVTRAKSLVMATDDDLMNLEVAIDARQRVPGLRVVMRMFDQELAEKIKESFGLRLTFSTSEIAAPLFATASSDRTIFNAIRIGDRLMAVARIDVAPGSGLIGTTVADMRRDHSTLVLEIRRGGKAEFIPAPDDAIRDGDRLTIQCPVADLKQVHQVNGDLATA